MKIIKSDLFTAVEKKILEPDQVNKLWNHLELLKVNKTNFHSLHLLYYFGGALILASMSWFMTKAWSNGLSIMILSLTFAISYLLVGNSLWKKQDLKIPAGLLITAASGLTPLFIYGLQKYTGVWSEDLSMGYTDYHFFIREQWVYLEIGTIISSLIILRFYKFAFIAFPLAISMWYLSLDITPFIFGQNKWSFDEAKIVSCIFGIFMLICSYLVNKKYKEVDFAFWGYLFGMMSFWGGLSLFDNSNEISKLFYGILNIILIICSIYLRRKIFMIFGTIGISGYLGHLSWEVFQDSLMLPIVLSITGFFIIMLGIKYKKNKQRIEAFIESYFPRLLIKWRPVERI